MINGPKTRYDNLVHDYVWNNFCDLVNHVRSSIGGTPQWRSYPILAHPNESNAWLWEQLVGHCARSGVNWTGGNQYFTFFKSFDSKIEDDLAVEILSRHDEPWPVLPDLPEVPLDSDQVETAGFVTTYAEYMEHAKFAGAMAGAA